METSWYAVVWQQFGAAIDTLEQALVACPTVLWEETLWQNSPEPALPEDFAKFWYTASHTLFWLDFYLTAAPPEPKEPKKEPGPVPTDPIIRLALRTKAIAGDHKKVTSIITRYREDITEMNFEEKSLLQRQIATWIGDLQSLLES